MSEDDARRWDARYRCRPEPTGPDPAPALLRAEPWLAAGGVALDLACGQGDAAVWLARRGLAVDAVDVSAVALDRLAALARAEGVAGSVRAVLADLDDGLPAGLRPHYDVVVCLRFRTPLLGVAARLLRPGGVVVASALSRVGREGAVGGPGAGYLAEPGELAAQLLGLDVLFEEEGAGEATIAASRR
jgi:SAM-dependent methyltransferase